jgi:hypothetical protein
MELAFLLVPLRVRPKLGEAFLNGVVRFVDKRLYLVALPLEFLFQAQDVALQSDLRPMVSIMAFDVSLYSLSVRGTDTSATSSMTVRASVSLITFAIVFLPCRAPAAQMSCTAPRRLK